MNGAISDATGVTTICDNDGPAGLCSIAVTPTNPTIQIGANQQFTATGTYSDLSTVDLTGSATWGSSSTGVATITAGGLAHACRRRHEHDLRDPGRGHRLDGADRRAQPQPIAQTITFGALGNKT